MATKKTAPEPARKDAYTRKAEARLEEAMARLDMVKAKIKGAVAGGQMELEATLKNAEQLADAQVETVKRRLARLREAGEDSWDDAKQGVDEAWEELSVAIKKIVARFS